MIKKTIRNLGKCFIGLEQQDERIIRQSVLVVDNGYSWLGHICCAIKGIKDYFPRAKITVLTLEERKRSLQKDFPALNYILPSQRLRPRRYQIALEMLKMRNKKYGFIALFSLDVTPLIAALIFLRSRVILYNQWGQWWSLRLRNVGGIFKFTYIKRKTRFNFKNLLKSMGLFFVLLQRKDEEALKHSILIVDNGHALDGQIVYAIQRIKEHLAQAKISILALEERSKLKAHFPELEIIRPGRCIIARYHIAWHMLKLAKNRYDYIILLSLDITPIIVSILFMNSKLLLHNQWHQWWLVKPKPISSYLMIIPGLTFNIMSFAYLLISVSWIFLKRSFNILRFNLLGKKS